MPKFEAVRLVPSPLGVSLLSNLSMGYVLLGYPAVSPAFCLLALVCRLFGDLRLYHRVSSPSGVSMYSSISMDYGLFGYPPDLLCISLLVLVFRVCGFLRKAFGLAISLRMTDFSFIN